MYNQLTNRKYLRLCLPSCHRPRCTIRYAIDFFWVLWLFWRKRLSSTMLKTSLSQVKFTVVFREREGQGLASIKLDIKKFGILGWWFWDSSTNTQCDVAHGGSHHLNFFNFSTFQNSNDITVCVLVLVYTDWTCDPQAKGENCSTSRGCNFRRKFWTSGLRCS